MVKLSAAEFIKEARRRRCFRTAGLYIVGAWVVVQIALAAFPALSISDSAVRYVWIAAIPGFPVALVFGWRYDIRGGGIVRAGPDDDVPLPLQRADYAVLLALLAIAFVIGAGLLREITEMDPTQVRLAAPDRSLAVLPFANMSADPDSEYFSDGLTETLLHMLGQLAVLKVAARTSSFAFKGRNIDIRDIALELGVRHVLEGSVQKAGDRIRVTAQLIRADDGFHVWSQNSDRRLVDIFAIQDEIAADVADALGSTLLTATASGIQGIETDDFSAYDIYLRALEQQNINSSESLDEAERLFAAAIDLDPEFVDARLGLARNYNEKYWKSAVRYRDPEELRVAQSLVGEVLEARPDNLSALVMDKLLQFYIG